MPLLGVQPAGRCVQLADARADAPEQAIEEAVRLLNAQSSLDSRENSIEFTWQGPISSHSKAFGRL